MATQTINDLGRLVKSKYPGQYDDLNDDELGRKIKAKFPGSYDDFSDVSTLSKSISDSRSWSEKLNLKNPIAQGATDFSEGVV
jgi:hypothetical protein